MKRIVLSLTIIAALSTSVLHAKEKLRILSTIKPIHSLVSAISAGLAESAQIIPNHASPHHYSLKPSDLRRINSADLIFRIDPNLERFLQKSIRNIPEDKVISLADATGASLLHTRGIHKHDEHTEENRHHESTDSKHSEQNENAHSKHDHQNETEPKAFDYHLWLNPDNAIAMANLIRESLIIIAPAHSEKLINNTKQLVNDIRKQNELISKQLKPVKDTPFLVMHDAWQYFTQYYQLNQLGNISAQERLKPSAKSISKARATIAKSKIHCLVAEPNLKTKTLRTLTEGLPVKVTQIDPLGREIPESNLAYPQLLQYTADKLLNCLKQK